MFDSLDDLLQRIMVLVLILLITMIVLRKLSEAATTIPINKETEIIEDQVDGTFDDQNNTNDMIDMTDGVEDEGDEEEDIPTTPPEPQIVHLDEDTHSNVSSADSEIIEDEMQKQLKKCTCSVPIKMYRLGGGKYRFSDSKRMCLVRILRSAIMVRVGGGWLSLEEFLLKHDPCRSDRINLVSYTSNGNYSQEMMAFKSKRLESTAK